MSQYIKYDNELYVAVRKWVDDRKYVANYKLGKAKIIDVEKVCIRV